jgi:hypothetical protein
MESEQTYSIYNMNYLFFFRLFLMMRFRAFPEIQLNPGMRDIGDISLYPLFPSRGTVTI